MQESLSALQENEPQQTEFGFEGYDEEPISEERFTAAENLTLTAITTASEFTDLFENARCISRIYSGKEDDVAGLYYIFRAHDAVTGRNIAVKTTNPALCEEHPQLEECLKWENAVLQRFKGKHRLQQICSPLRTMQANIQSDEKTFIVPISFFSSIYLSVDVRKSFFDEANDRLKTCANRLNLFCSLICAVQSIHREGICHRDLKPSNVMGKIKNGKCTAVLIDFGLSLAAEKIEKELRLFSPPADDLPLLYRAPELYSGFEDNWSLAQSADIYSLGCMLFELLDKRTFYEALQESNGTTFWEVGNNLRVGKEELNGNNEKRLALYNELLAEFAPAIIIPRISEDSIIPDYVRNEVQAIINSMCAFDYRKRTKENELDGIKGQLRKIARILENEHLRELYKKRKEIHRAKNSLCKEMAHA